MASYFLGIDNSDHIRAEIDKIQGAKRVNPRYTFILCPFHNEKSPSARIWHDNGRFQCYGCGTKKKWNELAAVLNLQQFGKDAVKLESQTVPKTNLDRFSGLLDTKGSNTEELRLYELESQQAMLHAGFSSRKWRGFDFDFLSEVGIRLAKVVETGRYYMYLPVTIKGKLRGYIKAQIQKPRDKKIPSYINSKGSWSRTVGLFGYDYAVELMKKNGWKTLVLVEGPRDALRLLRFGIPAVCILGTHSWGQKKLRLLEFSGAERIVLMFDGDKAGRIATKLIKSGLNLSGEKVAEPLNSVFQVKVVRLWLAEIPEGFNDSKYDPGNCPADILRQVQKLII